MSIYTNIKVNRKNSEAEIQAEISALILENYRAEALLEIQKDFELPGFRKGQVPLKMVEERVDPIHILEDAANAALRDAYPEILAEEKLEPITAPRVTITKLAPNNPLEFRIRVGLFPQINLPDYRKISKKVMDSREKPEVTETDLEETLNQIRQMRTPPGEGGGAESKPFELTDESVKSLGEFKDLEDFKNKIRANLQNEKNVAQQRQLREKISERLVEESKFTLPELMIEEELHRFRNQREEDMKRMNLSWEDYLKKTGKTEEQLTKEERNYIERQLKTKLLLDRIAEEEKLEPDAELVEHDVEILSKRHPEMNRENIRDYVRNMLRNEQVLNFLEGEVEEKNGGGGQVDPASSN